MMVVDDINLSFLKCIGNLFLSFGYLQPRRLSPIPAKNRAGQSLDLKLHIM